MSSPTVRRMLGESARTPDPAKDQPKTVIEATRPTTYHVCPHCHQEIYEKHTYSEDNGLTERHSDCGGRIEWPEQPLESYSEPWRSMLAKTRAERNAAR